jgi:CRP-like cAMP-binding protein
MSDLAGRLASLSLFAGLPASDLDDLAASARTVELAADEPLFRQNEDADGLYAIEAGRVGVWLRLPGGREHALATIGPGELIGELALLDGGVRSATVRAVEPTQAFVVGRAAFAGLAGRRDSVGLIVKERLASLACARLRRRHESLAEALGVGPLAPAAPGDDVAAAEAPAVEYLLRLPFLRRFDEREAAALIALGRVERVPEGHVFAREGEQAEAWRLVLNGAVEEVIRRPAAEIRVRLAGPGRGFGVPAVVDGLPASVTSFARERAVVLTLARETFERAARTDAVVAPAFAEALLRDLTTALRVAERPQARVAAARRL